MRSMRRGIKEMDLILSAFAAEHLAKMDAGSLDDYDALLNENDQDLYRWLYLLGREEGIQIEPSAAAGFNGPSFIKQYAQGQGAHSQNQLHNTLKNSTQIIWATGGSLVPEPEYRMFYDKGHDINGDAVQD